MADRPDPRPDPGIAPPPANRAARRANGRARPASPRGGGKVREVRIDHATGPRQYAARRRG